MKSRTAKTKKLPVHALSVITFVTGITALILAIVVVKIGVPQASQAASAKKSLPQVICLSSAKTCVIDNVVAQRFKGKDLSDVIIAGALYKNVNGVTVDFSNTIFQNVYADFMIFDGDVDFSNDDFTGALFEKIQSNSGHTINFTNANFTNVNFQDSNFNGDAVVTGVTWSNTTCPDGTNSDNDGNTCVGHGF